PKPTSPTPQDADKGPSASLAPSTAGSTYGKYASPAAFGRRLASGPFSPSCSVCGHGLEHLERSRGRAPASPAQSGALGETSWGRRGRLLSPEMMSTRFDPLF